jgi:peptidoglycan hydrolase CwlO-like protein
MMQSKELKQNLVEMKSEKSRLKELHDSMAGQLETTSKDNVTLSKRMKEKEAENSELREKVTELADQLVNLKRSVKELIQIRTRNLQKQKSNSISAPAPPASTAAAAAVTKTDMLRRLSAAKAAAPGSTSTSSGSSTSLSASGIKPTSLPLTSPLRSKLPQVGGSRVGAAPEEPPKQ